MNKKYAVIIGILCVIGLYLLLPTISNTCFVLTMPDSDVCFIFESAKFYHPVTDDIWEKDPTGKWYAEN